MFQLEWPLTLLLLPLPALVYFLLPAQQQVALRVPALDDFRFGASTRIRMQPRRWQQWLSLLAWLLLVLAASRPQWLGETVEIPLSGRDLMLAVDLSDSMRTADFILEGEQVNRLQATRQVASRFIERRRGDRLGLILFGSQAYLQTPLTFDRATVATLLDEAVIGIAGRETAIGDAIGMALKRLQGREGEGVLILLTDGANTAGQVSPQKATELAAQQGLRIHTIGVGGAPRARGG